ncbi:hypothetical protein BOO25_18935 [Vibrio navarrensis]|nr:hypothetical protein [Vibrio navarrensis]
MVEYVTKITLKSDIQNLDIVETAKYSSAHPVMFIQTFYLCIKPNAPVGLARLHLVVKLLAFLLFTSEPTATVKVNRLLLMLKWDK